MFSIKEQFIVIQSYLQSVSLSKTVMKNWINDCKSSRRPHNIRQTQLMK